MVVWYVIEQLIYLVPYFEIRIQKTITLKMADQGRSDIYVVFKVQMKCFFFIPEFERAAKIRKIAVYRFLISFLVPEL